ncbi:hypothetical protein F3Y22_tig00000132pilonHSYRG00170 [Hibiscus syriacus]|uniref:RNase H type-1 domain-containing protein n=1 Tax=Hibiscus syriacus TaxID=106335 RepID=A0A6A3D6B4_HIBSY|nr:hypothetical protein F3Y22_tig00000132pilonHSYRG00170 [Hibiscus syriacus]
MHLKEITCRALTTRSDDRIGKHVSQLTCGGVIWDHVGVWHVRFVKFIGVCSVVKAEIWGVFLGLCHAWDRGFRQIIIEIDSLDALSVIKNHMLRQAKPTILYHVSELLQRAWVVKFEHVGRDGNLVADDLAKLANVGDLQCVTLDAPPLSVLHVLHKDVQTWD